MWEVLVEICLHPEIRDPEGLTIKKAAGALGFGAIRKVSVGKAIRLTIDAESAEEARQLAKSFCDALLINPVLNFANITVLGFLSDIQEPQLRKNE